MGNKKSGNKGSISPWVIGGACLVLGLGASAVAVAMLRDQAKVSEEQLQALTALVESKNLTLKISTTGTVVPVRSVNLSPKNSGRLEEVFVKQGDRLRQGDLIALMESQDLDAQLLQAQARLAQARARLAENEAGDTQLAVAQQNEKVNQAREQIEIESFAVKEAEAQVAEAKAQRNLAQKQYERNIPLVDAGAISRDRLDEIALAARRTQTSLDRTQASLERVQTGLRVARSRLEEAELSRTDAQGSQRPEQIEQAQAQVAEILGQIRAIEVQKQDTRLVAPFDGIVTQRYADPGAFVTPTTSASSTASATSTSVVALAQGLEVLANLPEADISTIRPGQAVEVRVDSYVDQVFQGEVRLISPEAVKEQNVTSFQIRVALTTGESQLRSGMNADLAFVGNVIDNALVVPTVAIVTREGKRGLLLPNAKNEPEFREATAGVTIGNQTQILSGAKLGDRVFIDLPPGRQFQEPKAKK
ncbi:MAG: HlyD family efflux transporter periplasmic adaptor subunit [Synechococcales cyanobacterium CRU_2_2]|nr:HlyD family efflux transporter periplasmic adaptor subunit [Synechococcales cyanobacterium CRU_2_2]